MLGVFVGALLAEGALFIPYWRALPAEEFFALHKVYGPRLYRFFAPLTIVATAAAVIAAIACALIDHRGRRPTIVAGILSASMVVLYFLYFKRANARFAAASLNADELSEELARWASWHWARVVIGAAAFAAALLGLTMHRI
jgi:hypothetical protein